MPPQSYFPPPPPPGKLAGLLQYVSGLNLWIKISFLAIAVLVIGGAGFLTVNTVLHGKKPAKAPQSTANSSTSITSTAPPVTSFAECKAAPGSTLSLATPQQCTTSTGQVFTDTAPATAPSPSNAATTPAASKPSGGSTGTGTGSSGGSSGSGLSCTNPVYTATWPQTDYAGWPEYGSPNVQNDVQSDGTGPNTDSEQLNVCSTTNWNVVANWTDRGGSINAYPDTNFDYPGDYTVSHYSSMQTCFGEKEPTPSGPQWPTAGGSEWDYAYDVWINNHTGENTWSNDIEIMVWNDYTDTSIYPPAGSRAVTIDGVAYHLYRGGGANEWIYTRDTKVTSGCFDMLNIMKDMINNGSATTINADNGHTVALSTSGLTNSGAPQHLEYGVEISGTHGTQTFQITNATLTVQ